MRINALIVSAEHNDKIGVQNGFYKVCGTLYTHVSIGSLSVYFEDRAQILELAEKLTQAVQEWEE